MHGAARLLSAYASAFSSGAVNRVRLRSGELRTTGHTRARGRAPEAKRSLTAAAGEFPSCVAIWWKCDAAWHTGAEVRHDHRRYSAGEVLEVALPPPENDLSRSLHAAPKDDFPAIGQSLLRDLPIGEGDLGANRHAIEGDFCG
jgi:hypothetical protein